MANRLTPSRLARFITGEWHTITPEEVGFKTPQAIACAFRCACAHRGYKAETKCEANTITMRSVSYLTSPMIVTVRKRPSEPMSELDDDPPETILTEASEHYRLSGQYLETKPGSSRAREMLNRWMASR
jgi:hypothetical protein